MVNQKKSQKSSSKAVRATPAKRVTKNKRHIVQDGAITAINRLYSKSAPMLIFEALLFICVAAVLFIKPVLVLTIFTYVVGVALLLFGIYRMLCGFTSDSDTGSGGIDVVFGLINSVLGILFLVYPSGSLVSIAYIFVVLFFFKATRVLVFSINMARARFGHYIVTLFAGLVLFALSVALFFFPLGTFIAMTYYLGILLVVYAVADIYMFVELNKLKQLVRN